MRNVTVRLRSDAVIGPTDRRLFGAFVEHLGRCVYGGIFEPDHPTADAGGFRQDVLALVRELGPSVIRYPGGNFVSGYNWEDGVGPVAQRPARLDLAWLSTETNAFGTNEFIDWCRAAGVEPMLAVNLGTRDGGAARRLVEYCNHPAGTALSEQRRAHGWDSPHAVKLWCLGNEMDGPWQMQAKTADEYGRAATEAAKLMRWVDPSVQLVACGSSGPNMPTFGAWEQTVLEHCYEQVDYVSLHLYLNDYAADPAAMLATGVLMDRFIEQVTAIADGMAARRHAAKRMMLSFDEWNVWYRTRRRQQDRTRPGWPVAPPILEEHYSMLDALAFGGMCISLLNHADRVKIACLAQLVNVIAPIMTETGGTAWRQTIFHPFAQFSGCGRGTVLRADVDAPEYTARYYDPRGAADLWFPLTAPYLALAAVHDPAQAALTVFALNRSLTEAMPLEMTVEDLVPAAIIEATQLRHHDLHATNTKEHPDRVAPAPLDAVRLSNRVLTGALEPASWNVIRLRTGGG